MIFEKKCKDWVDREENMYTNFGLSGKASEVLWEMMKESGPFSGEVKLLLSKSLRYYKSINEVVNLQIRRHFLKLIRDESFGIARHICIKYRAEAETFLRNVLSQMYKCNLEKVK